MNWSDLVHDGLSLLYNPYFNLNLNMNTAFIGDELPTFVAGWCSQGLGHMLEWLVTQGHLKSNNQVYLELGTFCGRSLIYALRNQKGPHGPIAHVIDPLPDSMRVGPNSTVWIEWNKNIDAYGIRENIILHREKIECFQGEIKNVGLALIDGNHDSGHTYEALKKCESYYAEEALIIVDDYNIYGGNGQTPYPGHDLEIGFPVRKDVHRYLAESYDKTTVVAYTPWVNGQLYIYYRNK